MTAVNKLFLVCHVPSCLFKGKVLWSQHSLIARMSSAESKAGGTPNPTNKLLIPSMWGIALFGIYCVCSSWGGGIHNHFKESEHDGSLWRCCQKCHRHDNRLYYSHPSQISTCASPHGFATLDWLCTPFPQDHLSGCMETCRIMGLFSVRWLCGWEKRKEAWWVQYSHPTIV